MQYAIFVLAGSLAVFLPVVGCESTVGQRPSPNPRVESAGVNLPAPDAVSPSDFPGIHNVVAYHPGFYSGAVPEGSAGFDSIAALGCRTIISVDGAPPDVEAAKARGIRYIHLPIGYNGMTEERKVQLAKATRDAMERGPVYLHCHHGKHRSAAAAGTVAVCLGWAAPEAMVGRMEVSGTSPAYTGLYECTASAGVLSVAVLESVGGEFPEVSLPAGLVRTMVDIDHATDHLKSIEKAGWVAPPDHPDLVAAAEAGRLVDLLRSLETDSKVKAQPAEFGEMLRTNAAQAQTLEDLLVSGTASGVGLSAALKAVTKSCTECHVKYRD